MRLLAAALCCALTAAEPEFPSRAEFHFIRMEYTDIFQSGRAQGGFRFAGGGRGWWRQDWPAAEIHFAQGIRRLTRIDTGVGRHMHLKDDRIFDHPWLYATQVGWWDLSDLEIRRLREYLNRGGFLVVDDFHGFEDWELFRQSMLRLFPGALIEELDPDHPAMNLHYQIKERTYIPGLRHLRRAPGGGITVQPQAVPPTWRGIHDERGRLLVAINFNMDIGDAWEHADMPEYPEAMTSFAYRLGLNYIIYSMTH